MKVQRAKMLTVSVALLFAGIVWCSQSAAAGRNVVVNGTQMDAAQLAYLDQVHCMPIPNGSYFLTQVGNDALAWGYAALPGIVQGYLGEECQRGGGGASGSSGGTGSYGWSDGYSQTYGGGISAGDGTFEYYDGASGSFVYQ